MTGSPAARSLLASLALLSLSQSAAAQPAETVASESRDFRSKKDRWLDAKRAAEADGDEAAAEKKAWREELDRRTGKKPPDLINVFNLWTHEYVAVNAEASEGPPLSAERSNRFLRCHFTNEPADMDPRLFGVLIRAARHFNVKRVHIISGFRAPKYNLILRKKGREVARRSQHTLGKAVDFRLPGVSTRRLHRWARSLKLGGVGYYPSSRFIHVDTGRVRYWSGR